MPDEHNDEKLKRQVTHLREVVEQVRSEQQEAKKRDENYTGRTTNYALVTTVFTGVLAVMSLVGLWQAYLLRESNGINRESLQSAQRAYVSFSPRVEAGKGTGPDLNLKKVEFWMIRVPIANNGNTVIKRGKAYVNKYASNTPIDEKFDFTDKDATGEVIPGPLFIGPHDTIYTRAMQVPIQTIQDVYDKKAHFYVYGWADYRDIFDTTPDRTTRFCYELTLVGIDGETHDLKPQEWSLCQNSHGDPLNNCVDEECKLPSKSPL